MKKILYFLLPLIASILVGNCNDNSSPPDYSTPEETIHFYHRSLEKKNIENVRSCFRDKQFSEDALGKFWKEYKIIERVEYDKQKVEEFKNSIDFKYDERRDPKEGDVAIVVLEKMKSKGETKEFEFWYLLRKIDNKWLIISHSAIGIDI